MSRSGGSAFRHRDFTLFWVAQLVTGLSLQMASVAIGWQVYAIRNDPLDLGLIGLAEFLPLPILALPAGQLADRVSRRLVVAAAIGVEVGVFAGLYFVTVHGARTLWPFLAFALLIGIVAAFLAPAGRALTPSLVPEEILSGAMALRGIAFQASTIAGPVIGGLLFELRPELVYSTAAALDVAGFVCVMAVRSGRGAASTAAPGIDSVLGGVRLIRRTPVLFGAISLDLFAVLLGGASALMPVFAKDVLHVGPAGLGLLRTAPAVGALVAAFALARWSIGRNAGKKLLAVVAIFGVCMIVFGLSRTMWLSLTVLVISGAADMLSVVLRSTLVPLVTPDELRGRVLAVESVFISASNELGAFESGVAAALLGAVPAVVLGGMATIAIAAAWARFFPDLRNVDRLDELRPIEAGA